MIRLTRQQEREKANRLSQQITPAVLRAPFRKSKKRSRKDRPQNGLLLAKRCVRCLTGDAMITVASNQLAEMPIVSLCCRSRAESVESLDSASTGVNAEGAANSAAYKRLLNSLGHGAAAGGMSMSADVRHALAARRMEERGADALDSEAEDSDAEAEQNDADLDEAQLSDAGKVAHTSNPGFHVAASHARIEPLQCCTTSQ